MGRELHPHPEASTTQRLLTRQQAAERCGLTESGFSSWVVRKLVPGPLPGTRRWDAKALDQALDHLSGLDPEHELTPYESTRSIMRLNLTAVENQFGTFPLAAVGDRMARVEFLNWHDRLAKDYPRAADAKVAAFARVLSWGLRSRAHRPQPDRQVHARL